jgi:hypothetical protein
MLPVNQPKCPFHNNHNDGRMNFMHKAEEVRGAVCVRVCWGVGVQGCCTHPVA